MNDEPGSCLFAIGAVLIGLGLVGMILALAGCAPPPAHVTAPAWMLTPVPTVDVGVDRIDVWNCVTAPETVCTEWHQPVTN